MSKCKTLTGLAVKRLNTLRVKIALLFVLST